MKLLSCLIYIFIFFIVSCINNIEVSAENRIVIKSVESVAKNKIVVAHWILPMSYTEGENKEDRNKNDIRAAIELGIDGFAINAFSGDQAKGIIASLIKSADSIGASNFKIFLSADMSLKFKAKEIVDTVKDYSDNPHYLKINGKSVLSTYGGSDLGNSWWQNEVLLPLKALGVEVTFIPYFDRPNPNADAPSYKNWLKVVKNHQIADGLFNFLMPGSTPFYSDDPNIGHYWWSTLESEENLAKALHDSGKIFMAPFMPYYWAACHSSRQYMEHQGGRGMNNYWKSIIELQQPEIVQIVTWNDYAESTYIQPTRLPLEKINGIKSQPHLGYYELLKYYISWYKTGKKPKITKDGIFFFYRIHSNDAVATNDSSACSRGPIQKSQKWGFIQDVIYITTALTEAAELQVISGGETKTYNVSEGINTIDVPFKNGTQNFVLIRDSKKILQAKGTNIEKNPAVYNFNVYSGYAIASGHTSETWLPSDLWRTGFISDWFVKQ